MRPRGVCRDKLVEVDSLKFPVYFYVLDMNANRDEVPILLGRPFFRTSKTKTNVEKGSLSTEFNGKMVELNVFDTKLNQMIHLNYICWKSLNPICLIYLKCMS